MLPEIRPFHSLGAKVFKNVFYIRIINYSREYLIPTSPKNYSEKNFEKPRANACRVKKEEKVYAQQKVESFKVGLF